ncbi:sporulation protein Cse60 [Staphylococcus shinii]|uniref:sporulation protein Cse60 n=1 Tax=Staphylococcus shinii TaxID=2912228 RepID=UPI00298F17BE|nr:sporulation protein Cse60 [Staphylococcus shinii]MDW8564694.1 sporulation protein Cse60 [Staphylococcus shinii]
MIKVKVFRMVHFTDLEELVNDWLKRKVAGFIGRKINVINATQSQNDDYVTLTIFYEVIH